MMKTMLRVGFFGACLAIMSDTALAQSVQPVRPIRAHVVIAASDLIVDDAAVAGGLTRIEDAVGLEARVTLYPGRPIRHGDVGPVALIERNQPVRMIYSNAGLVIQTEGRALERAGVGDRIRVMNAESRAIVSGVVMETGEIEVSR